MNIGHEDACLELVLYTRPGCHLCEQAQALLQGHGITPVAQDISADLALLGKYGTRIPVLKRADNGAELGWPFDAQALKVFLH